MKAFIIAIGILLFPLLSLAQDVPSQQKLEGSENASIMMYLRIASAKYDSLMHYQQFIQYAEQQSNKIRMELMFLSNEAEKEC